MRVHMIANAHIDPVWLWRWQAGADEALATAASMADRCDEYPEFVFTRGEAWLYARVERLRPDLFDRIRALIERGQWHVTGGQFIQPDLNLPTAAGLHRQIEHGQRYFRDRFGIAPGVGYNVDSFGHTATLPDILARHGYTPTSSAGPSSTRWRCPPTPSSGRAPAAARWWRSASSPATSPTSPTSPARSASPSRAPTRRSATPCASTAPAITVAARRRR